MKIPISEIKPHPNNPRSFLQQDITDAVAKSMDKDGLLNPVKLALLTDDRKAGDGLLGQGINYYILCGHYRYAGAKQNGWTEIEAVVVKGLSPADEMLELIMGNKAEPPNWFDNYLGIEKYMALCPDLNNQEVADRLQLRFQYVGNVAKVMGLLNTAAREQICGQLRNPELSTGWKIPESAVIALTGLANGYPDDVDKMEKTIKVLIERKMTEKQAKKIAAWIKAGNTPESFGEGGKTHPSPLAGEGLGEGEHSAGDGQDGRYAKLLQEMRETGYFQIKSPAKGGVHIIIADEDSGVLAALGAAGAIWWLGHKDSKLEDNPYWADLPAIIKEVQGSRLNVQGGQEVGKVQGSKAQDVQGEGMVSESQIPNSENPKLNSGFELAHNIITQAENHVPKSLLGKIGHAVFKQVVKWVKKWMKKR